MVRRAAQVVYVTQSFLQKRYPNAGLTVSASNVEITKAPAAVLEARLSKITTQSAPYAIGMIGNYGNTLKGLHVALRALGRLRESGIGFRLYILGSGDPKRWARLINKHKLQDNIEFCGTLAGGQAVLDWLDSKDIYIQPSLHEGLPRAVIEAMSRGLPCLASDAGGTAELLPADCIHKAGDAKALYAKLRAIWHDKEWQTGQAKRNFTIAQGYTDEALKPIRHQFWQCFSQL